MNTTKREYYEIKSPCDRYGLGGTFESEEKALEEINYTYRRALERGYDNRNEKWVIVCVQTTIIRNDKNEFLKEETIRFVTQTAEFSEYENAYVFVC